MYQPEFNSVKFRELALFIADKSRNDDWFGAVKLNKILYYCDFKAFAWLEKPITDATYIRLREGPAPRELLPERHVWEDGGYATIESRRIFTFFQQRLVPTSSDIGLGKSFNNEERRLVDYVLNWTRDMTGKEITELSHGEVGWAMADDKEVIPYETAFLVSLHDHDAWAIAGHANG